MRIIYFPNTGFQIDTIAFNWKEDRSSVRIKLLNTHKEDDRIIEMSEFFGGDTSHNMEQRRDIYKDIKGAVNYFFLSYDAADRLCELEVHWGIEIKVKNIDLKFEEDINEPLKRLERIGEKYLENEEGDYLFENLKMTIANAESIGGEGNNLAYFYCAENIEHLR